MKSDEAIRILITGGTIDKEYDPLTGELTFSKSHLSNMLNQVRCKVRFILEEVMLKDRLMFVEVAQSLRIRSIHYTSFESTRAQLGYCGLSLME
jgi:L-asparaginase